MAFGFIILVLVLLFVFLGACLGWAANSKVTRIDQTLLELKGRLRDTERRLDALGESPDAAPARPKPKPIYLRDTEPLPKSEPEPRPAAKPAPEPAAESSQASRDEPPAPPREPEQPAYQEPSFFDRLLENMQQNWMAWLGGVSVALAGIFLVGYSIEMGWLGPRARIGLALLIGFALHAAADWFRRRTQTAHPAFAAMAGGASITLYAALFAALELYGLLSPGMTFALLAAVSLLTMALATVHGPVLAIIGLLGAYVVPILVSQHGGGSLIELIYSLIVTTAALFLIRFVYRPWLWFGIVAGALGWWLLSLSGGDADGFRGLYLAAFTYLLLAIPTFDWQLRKKPQDGDPGTEQLTLADGSLFEALQLTIPLIILAHAISIINLGFSSVGEALLQWTPLIAILLWSSASRESLRLMPWALLVAQLIAWLIPALDDTSRGIGLRPLSGEIAGEFLAFAFLMALLFSVGIAQSRRGKPFSHLDASLTWLSPVLWLTLSYLLVTDLSVTWEWSLATLVLGLSYIFISGNRLDKDPADGTSLWLIIGGHAAYSLAAAMFFREATLTLALTAQVISLAWINRRYSLPAINWIIKGVLAVVVARLTLNPWLLTYPADVHWSLWTYGGSTLLCFLASRLTTQDLGARKWLEAATLHLLVLFLGAEIRYWLYDGLIFVQEFTLTEAAINTVLWGGLGLSYYNRRRSSETLAEFYTVCSKILLTMSLISYAMALLILNPLWGVEPISSTRVWNILLLAYGAPVLLAAAAWLFYDREYRNAAASIGGGALFIFVTLQIRHLWHGALDLDLGFLDGEQYTYSAVWLAMAITTMLSATRLGSQAGHKIGMGLLMIVIGKIFIFDMAGLEGLLRVASFMGLGLALLGLAWLYQRTAQQAATNTR